MQQATQSAAGGETASSSRHDAGIDVASHALGWLNSLRARFHALTHLAIAEAKLAAVSAATVCCLVAATIAFLLVAWGLMIAGLVFALAQTGVSPWLALLGFALFHVLVAGLMALRALAISRHVNFSATREQMAGRSTS